MSKSLSQKFIETARRGSFITKSEVRGLRKRWRISVDAARSQRKEQIISECVEFMDKVGPFKVDPEWTESGLEWWRNQVFRKNGELRETKWMADNNGKRAAEAIKTFVRFELIAFEWDWSTYYGELGSPYPVIRIVGKNGAMYTYSQRGWQSGGNRWH